MTPFGPKSLPVRCVVFDLDGLMIDTEPIFRETAGRLLARRGRQAEDEVLQAMMGSPARQALELLRRHHRLSESLEELALESSRVFFEILGERTVPLMPGLLDLLDDLQRRAVPMAIATSSSGRYVRRILAPHQILERFAFILTCDDVHVGKPDPEIYAKAAARFGVAPPEMLVLEDSPNGLKAAKAAVRRCVVVPHVLVLREALVGADAVVSSLADPALQALLELPRSPA